MRSPSANLPSTDQWLSLPDPPDHRREQSHRKLQIKSHRRLVRSILFGKGNGHLKNLSPADRDLVRTEIRESYSRYTTKAKIEGRTPLQWPRFVLYWKKVAKSSYRRCDVPRRLKEHFRGTSA
jgi:hypothetical protein